MNFIRGNDAQTLNATKSYLKENSAVPETAAQPLPSYWEYVKIFIRRQEDAKQRRIQLRNDYTTG